MKNPQAHEFIKLIMERLGATNPSDLSEKLGGRWTSLAQQRKLYKWYGGQQGPTLEPTLELLEAAGLLKDTGGDGLAAMAAAPEDPIERRLAALEATVEAQGKATTTALKALVAGIRRLELQPATAAPPARKRKRA